MPPNRPSALDVSFGPDPDAMDVDNGSPAPTLVPSAPLGPSAAILRPGSALGKRKSPASDQNSHSQAGSTSTLLPQQNHAKRRQLPKSVYYKPPANTKVFEETEDLVLVDEDPDALEEDEKPVREFNGFSFFDPTSKPKNLLLSLAELESLTGSNHHIEGAGYASAIDEDRNDEDEGQEDDEELASQQYIHLGAIFGFSIDFTVCKDPVYIETQYAWYSLQTASELYQDFWREFYTPLFIAQLAISSALDLPKSTNLKAFVAACASKVLFGQSVTENDFLAQANNIREAIESLPDQATKIKSSSFIKTILSQSLASASTKSFLPTIDQQAHNIPSKKIIGNLDNSVLHPDNQTQTVVTPRIAYLANGYFQEKLKVPAKLAPPVIQAALPPGYLWNFIQEARLKKSIMPVKSSKVIIDNAYYGSVKLNNKIYKTGDVVLIPRSEIDLPTRPQDIPIDTRLSDIFWFGLLWFIHADNLKFHIQWFNHGSTTCVSELAHPQELFLDYTCEDRPFQDIAGTVEVTLLSSKSLNNPVCKNTAYFCKETGSFTSLDLDALDFQKHHQLTGQNCFQCLLSNAQTEDKKPKKLLKSKIINGFSYGGTSFHYHDFILYTAEQGPGNLGFITGFSFNAGDNINDTSQLVVKKVGRIQDLPSGTLPNNILKDPHHLYLTKEQATISIKDCAKVVFVACIKSLESAYMTLEEWLQSSPDHFYVSWCFDKLNIAQCQENRKITCQDLQICPICCQEQMDTIKQMSKFTNKSKKLPTLDLFGGVGAFSKGLASGSKSLVVTHAIEISPSAAETFRINSPKTIVYNQCANEVLQYAMKLQDPSQSSILEPPYDKANNTPIPLPPKPGQISVITAGFPCQGHSSLNMFRTANDRKNNLLVTTLSYVDFYNPAYVFFENVPGFLKFGLKSIQISKHYLESQIESGGLKLCIRALLDMNYQVRFGLLQAAHYGAPQRRLRFFLVAAKKGYILPDLPQPTHDFPEQGSISIKIGTHLKPVFIQPGTALHGFVTVEDAIGDLLQFDWKYPKSKKGKAEVKRPDILSIDYDKSSQFSGPQNQQKYQSKPQTRYQKLAQAVEPKDLQHFTKVLPPKKVERVLSIPLMAKANYQSIPAKLGEWQLVDPSSSLGKSGYRPSGAYNRIDKNGVFQTTVTNVDPTAKQSQVLHPWCHRIVTVRELARSQGFPDNFVFKSLNGRIVDMHRQIGNAVPIQIGEALGRELKKALFEKHKSNLAESIEILDDDV